MQKVLVIVGPTAVGKTAFSVQTAQKFDGEIISGDSVQIYRSFDIGSGKIKPNEMQGVPHYLIDKLDYHEDYNVANFQSDARRLIDEISERHHLPMIVGGTGLYIKAALYDYVFNNEQETDNQYEDLSNEDIYQKLLAVDPKCLEKIHVNNRRRLVRALNVYEKNQKGISEIKDEQKHEMLYDAKIIGLTCERERLYQRINQRVDQMFSEGLIKEINDLIKMGVTFADKPMSAIGYRQFEPLVKGECGVEEVSDNIKRDTRHFAKRQYTWFNHQTPIEWFDIDELDKALVAIKEWLDE